MIKLLFAVCTIVFLVYVFFFHFFPVGPVGGGKITEQDLPPKLGEEAASEHFVLTKLPVETYSVYWDSAKQVFEVPGFRISADGGVAKSNALDGDEQGLMQLAPAMDETASYYFSGRWADETSPIRLVRFLKKSRGSGLTPYFGLSHIATHWEGQGVFSLAFMGEKLEFRTYSKKQIYASGKYWAHLNLYLPPKDAKGNINMGILSASDPMDHLGDNGLYLIHPKQVKRGTEAMPDNKRKLGLNKPLTFNGSALSLDRIDRPAGNFPGDRLIYNLTFEFPAGESKNNPSRESFRFDPYNSGKEYSFGAFKFRIYTAPGAENCLLVQF